MNLNEFKCTKNILFFLLTLALFQGCQKDNFDQNNLLTTKNTNDKLSFIGLVSIPDISIPEMPQNVNGVLYFTDRDHLTNYFDFLDAMIQGDDDDLGNTSQLNRDSILNIIEHNLHFTSYRNKEDNLLTHVGITNPKEYFEKDYIRDDIFKSVLNEYAEFGIGDTLIVYFSKSLLLGVTGNNINENQESIRLLEKGGDIPWAFLGNDVKPISESFIISTCLVSGGSVPLFSFSLEPACEGKVNVVLDVKLEGTNQAWGNGVIYTFNNRAVVMPDGRRIKTPITPGVTGSFSLTVEMTTTDELGETVTEEMTATVSGLNCHDAPSDIISGWVESSGGVEGGGVAISTWLKMRDRQIAFRTKITAGIKGYRAKRNIWTGEFFWKRKRGDLDLDLTVIASEFCMNITTFLNSDDCNDCRREKVVIEPGDYWDNTFRTFGEDAAQCDYQGVINGITLTDNLLIDLCP